MKIAYIASFIGPEFADKYCHEKNYSVSATLKSTALIRALLLAGHEVTVFSPGMTVCRSLIPAFSESIEFPEGKIKVIYPFIVSYRKCALINSLSLRRHMKKIIKNNSYDALLYYNITPDAALCLSLFKKVPKILEYEDNIFNKALRGNVNRFESFKKRLYAFVIKRTDAAIIVGKEMLNKGEVKTKVLIPGAVNEEVTNNINTELKSFDSSKPVKLVLAGSLHYSHGSDLLLKALEFIKQPCELYFYGSGHIDSETEALMKNVPERHKFILGGHVKHDKLIGILTNDSDILLNSTRSMGVPPNSEGFPFKMMEYASTGRPIVSSAIGRLDDDYNSKITFYDGEDPEKIAAAISYVIDNYDTCALQARQLQTRVLDEFSIKGISVKLADFIKQLDNK